jgi:hypothetical protein
LKPKKNLSLLFEWPTTVPKPLLYQHPHVLPSHDDYDANRYNDYVAGDEAGDDTLVGGLSAVDYTCFDFVDDFRNSVVAAVEIDPADGVAVAAPQAEVELKLSCAIV